MRALAIDHHSNALKLVSNEALIRKARELGLAIGNSFFEDELHRSGLRSAALHRSRRRMRGIDRDARSARLAAGSDEAIVLEAMRNDCFSIWQVQRRHEPAGIIVRNTLTQDDVWLVDIGLEHSGFPGSCFAARLVKPTDFMMTSGIIIPLIPEMLEAVLDEMPRSLQGAPAGNVIRHQRFVTALYRIALQIGILDHLVVQRATNAITRGSAVQKPRTASTRQAGAEPAIALNLQRRAN